MKETLSIKTIINTVTKLAKPNDEVYIVGGWLRDEIMGIKTMDMDLAVPFDPAKLAASTAKSLNGRCIVLDEKNRIYRVILFDSEISCLDISKFKGATIHKDLAMRDFTINALARALKGADIIDPMSGLDDIKQKTIRVCSPAAFKDDPLRMLRAFRFSAELGFEISPETIKSVRKNKALISKPAKERVRDELFRILATPDAAKILLQMGSVGLLTGIFPEILPMRRHSKKFYFHKGGLWEHSVKTFEAVEEVLAKPETFLQTSHKQACEYLAQTYPRGISRAALLKLAALFHDMAKPECIKKIDGRIRFLGHDSEGASMFERLLRRLRLSNVEISAGRTLVEHHMRPITLSQAPRITTRAIMRLFATSGEHTPELIILALADCLSYRNIKRPMKLTVPFDKQAAVFDEILSKYFGKKSQPPMPKIIDGTMLMNRFKLKPGPEIGKLLKIIADARMMGKVTSTKEALALAKKRL